MYQFDSHDTMMHIPSIDDVSHEVLENGSVETRNVGTTSQVCRCLDIQGEGPEHKMILVVMLIQLLFI